MIGVLLDYFDVAGEGCRIDKGLEPALGFKKIFVANKDIKVVDGTGGKTGNVEGSIFVASEKSNMIQILNMSPRAVVFSDSKINKKALEQMRDRDILLCIPADLITGTSGLHRSRNMYMMGKLFDHARSIKLEVSFITLAQSNAHLCSYMQLIEIAKLIGADEEYARASISKNGSLVIK